MNDTTLGLIQSIGRIPTKLAYFFAKRPNIAREIRRGYHLIQGTYISFEDALILCEFFNISPVPVRSLISNELAAMSSARDRDNHDSIDEGVDSADQIQNIIPGNTTNNIPDFGVNDVGADHALGSPTKPPNVALDHPPDPDSSRHSNFTEASYEYGSYLAPKNRSYLQLLT